MKCKRCSRILKSENSIKKGYGQLCFLKHKKERLKGYFKSSNIILDTLNEIIGCDICGKSVKTEIIDTDDGKIRICNKCQNKN